MHKIYARPCVQVGGSIDLDFPGDKGSTYNLSQKKKLRKLTSKTNVQK